MIKLFEVGDKVDSIHGRGRVMAVSDYIYIELDDGNSLNVTLDGRADKTDAYPYVWHDKSGTPPAVGEPPERFEYPLYRRSRESGAVVEFDSLTTGTVLDRGTSTYYFVGEPITDSRPHIDAMWEPCEKPKWKPTKPAWCWVWGAGDYAKRLRLIIESTASGYFDASNVCWPNAEPCKENEVPSYWPKEWV